MGNNGKIQCLICFDVIESKHRHDMRGCKCGACFVDGGSDYMRVGGNTEKILVMAGPNIEGAGEPVQPKELHSVQCAEQICMQASLEALRANKRYIQKELDSFFTGKNKPEAVARLNQEMSRIQKDIDGWENAGYDRWEDRKEEWRTDYDIG